LIVVFTGTFRPPSPSPFIWPHFPLCASTNWPERSTGSAGRFNDKNIVGTSSHFVNLSALPEQPRRERPFAVHQAPREYFLRNKVRSAPDRKFICDKSALFEPHHFFFRPSKVPVRATAHAFPMGRLGIRVFFRKWRDAMPDYEIRYFRADDSLVLILMCCHNSEAEAREHARLNQKDHARFELRAGDGSSLPRR
jgi:hypothetical protein